ncbi:MAG TPA: DUF1207 domain-containing protein [Parachlamydiaceae bacterium]|nr:DUF1207 domain-containing protein [Parachlamydiaceae bacterium]
MPAKNYLCALFIALSFMGGHLFGQDPSTVPLQQSGPCGCCCESSCSCGCDEKHACDCGSDGVINIAPPVTQINPQHCPFSESDCEFAKRCGLWGVWLPECPVLFRPLLADPRQIDYSVGWRFNDQVLGKNIIDISFGDTLAIYRWNDINIGPFCGQLQLELEGALWATFAPLRDSSPLIDADYYVGFPITYAFDRWQVRLRGYHVSTHMGDEFLIDNPYFYRRNPSAEFVDFFISNDFTDEIRYYAGIGLIVHQDETFKTGRVFLEFGSEVRLRQMGFTDFRNQLYGEPYYAMNFRIRKDFKHHLDQTYVIGYEIGKLYGLCRKLRFYLQYHDGYSLDGQFQKCATNYLSVRFSYGF